MSVGRVLLVSVVALAGYYAFLFLIQRRLLYPAPRGPSPFALPADAEPIELAAESGPVRAWFLPPMPLTGRPWPVIMFFHGNAERAENWLTAFQPARAAGFAVLVVEYPGYGEAPGRPTQASLTSAGLAAYDWVKERPGVDAAGIVAYGRSLGGGVAARLATRRPVGALILESSFTSLRAFAGRFLAPGFLVRDPFDNLTELNGYHGPLLVLHGAHDDIAPVAYGRALAAAKRDGQFVAMPCGHNDCERPWPDVLTFLGRYQLTASRPPTPQP